MTLRAFWRGPDWDSSKGRLQAYSHCGAVCRGGPGSVASAKNDCVTLEGLTRLASVPLSVEWEYRVAIGASL